MHGSTNSALVITGVVLTTVAVVAIAAVWMNRDGMMDGSIGYQGMIHGMGSMNGTQMMQSMRSELTDEQYAVMLQHMQDHATGRQREPGAGIDGTLHLMMDGMMGQMPGGMRGMFEAAPTATP